MYGSNDFEAQDVGQNYLLSMEEAQLGDRAKWGMQRGCKQSKLIVKECFRLLAFTGPSVIAIDQIDTLVAQSMTSIQSDQQSKESVGDVRLLEHIAGGLMSLREITRRALSLVSCLPNTWILIKTKATDTVADRFPEALKMHTVPDSESGRMIIEKRFSIRFAEIGFKAPYPSWPIKPTAFRDAPDFTPRGLLRRADDHITSCLRAGIVRELEQLDDLPTGQPTSTSPEPPHPQEDLAELDAQFGSLRSGSDIAMALVHRILPQSLQKRTHHARICHPVQI